MGEANSSMGTLLQVLVALRLEDDLEFLGKDDVLGQKLMDAELLRSTKPKTTDTPRIKKVDRNTPNKELET
jgi:hypothetical protein